MTSPPIERLDTIVGFQAKLKAVVMLSTVPPRRVISRGQDRQYDSKARRSLRLAAARLGRD